MFKLDYILKIKLDLSSFLYHDITSHGMRTVSPGEVVMEDDWLIITGR